MRITVIVLSLTIVSTVMTCKAFAQPPLEIPLTVTDGEGTDTLYFGILPGGHYCIDQRDTINGHVEFLIPHFPPSGVFDARLVWPRSGPSLPCFEMGSLYDFRPKTGVLQLDTFRVWNQLGTGRTTMVLSWPANLGALISPLTLRYFDQIALNNVNVNMLVNTSADVTNAGDPAVVRIFAGMQPMSVEHASRDVPGGFALNQNYPNPFNPSTRISFSIPASPVGGPHSSFVSLRVYDLLGKEVATLVNEQLGAGAYERTFSAEGLAGGVYFYRLQAAVFVQTKKLLLLR
jgi:hypothetical protein